MAVEQKEGELVLRIPDALRVSHEEHFGQVAWRFLSFVRDRKALPAWEKLNVLAKYKVTTQGTERSRSSALRVAPRRASQ